MSSFEYSCVKRSVCYTLCIICIIGIINFNFICDRRYSLYCYIFIDRKNSACSIPCRFAFINRFCASAGISHKSAFFTAPLIRPFLQCIVIIRLVIPQVSDSSIAVKYFIAQLYFVYSKWASVVTTAVIVSNLPRF